MFKHNSILIHEVIPILLLSILGSYIFDLEFDFSKRIDWLLVIKLFFIAISAVYYYKITVLIKYCEKKAERDFFKSGETGDGILKRYKDMIDHYKGKLFCNLLISLFSSLGFFLLDPTIKLF